MEKIVSDNNSKDIKPFEKDGSLTGRNLFHFHHNQTNSLGKNAKRFLDNHYNNYKTFQDKILELKREKKKSNYKATIT